MNKISKASLGISQRVKYNLKKVGAVDAIEELPWHIKRRSIYFYLHEHIVHICFPSFPKDMHYTVWTGFLKDETNPTRGSTGGVLFLRADPELSSADISARLIGMCFKLVSSALINKYKEHVNKGLNDIKDLVNSI